MFHGPIYMDQSLVRSVLDCRIYISFACLFVSFQLMYHEKTLERPSNVYGCIIMYIVYCMFLKLKF